jgi:hypothetical protein
LADFIALFPFDLTQKSASETDEYLSGAAVVAVFNSTHQKTQFNSNLAHGSGVTASVASDIDRARAGQAV